MVAKSDDPLLDLAHAAGFAMAAPDDEEFVQAEPAPEYETPWAKAASMRPQPVPASTALALLPAPVTSASALAFNWLRSYWPSLGRGQPA